MTERQRKTQALISISNEIGSNKAYIQGGGGNTSVKLDENLMLIKSSGTSLKDMSKNYGQCLVEYKKVNEFLNNAEVSESEFTSIIKSFCTDEESRPSIETGFHSLLGEYVIHTHSVFLNVLLCCQEGKEIIKELFPSSLWVDYATPGRNLTHLLNERLKDSEEYLQNELIVFLQNHGLIVSALGESRSIELHKEINQKVINFLNLKTFKIDAEIKEIDNKVLFPDQVVYLDKEQKLLSDAAKETFSAYSYILKEITDLGFTPNFLPDSEVKNLKNMESEKYRKSLVK